MFTCTDRALSCAESVALSVADPLELVAGWFDSSLVMRLTKSERVQARSCLAAGCEAAFEAVGCPVSLALSSDGLVGSIKFPFDSSARLAKRWFASA